MRCEFHKVEHEWSPEVNRGVASTPNIPPTSLQFDISSDAGDASKQDTAVDSTFGPDIATHHSNETSTHICSDKANDDAVQSATAQTTESNDEDDPTLVSSATNAVEHDEHDEDGLNAKQRCLVQHIMRNMEELFDKHT